MKLSLAHFATLIIAVILLNAGQATASLSLSKAGGVLLLLSTVLLFVDIAVGVYKSFQKDTVLDSVTL